MGFTYLVPAHLGSPGKRAVKRVCVCVCYRVRRSVVADDQFEIGFSIQLNRRSHGNQFLLALFTQLSFGADSVR